MQNCKDCSSELRQKWPEPLSARWGGGWHSTGCPNKVTNFETLINQEMLLCKFINDILRFLKCFDFFRLEFLDESIRN